MAPKNTTSSPQGAGPVLLANISAPLDEALTDLMGGPQEAELIRADLVTLDLPRIIAMLNSVLRAIDLCDHLVGDAGVGSIAVHGAADVVDHQFGAAACYVERIQASHPAFARDDDNLVGEVDHEVLPAMWSPIRC